MPVVVACQCGQRFSAEDRLVGQQVPCPVCGRVLSIGAPAPPRVTPPKIAPPPSAEGIYVACGCGGAFLAPPDLRGKSIPCPNCGGMIAVPKQAVQRSGPPAPPATFGVDPLAAQPALPQSPSAFDADKLAGMMPRIAIGAVILLAVAVTITSLVNWITRPRAESKAQPSASAPRSPAPQSGPAPSVPFKSVPAPPPPPGENSAAANATTSPEAEAGEATALARLPQAAQSWHQQPGAPLTGIRRAGPSETPAAHFSWFTSLLPFLGYTKLYEQIDFSQPVTKGTNLHAGCTSIPEFLNPADDRQKWQGHPFDGMGLTHFAGMSGVEDSRNVVAAQLPRSDPRAGVFGYDAVASPAQITDGTSQTAMIVGTGALANPWIFGGGGTVRGAREPLFDPTSGLGTKGLPGGGTAVVMADGSVRHVAADVDPHVFRAMCTTHGAESVDLERSTKKFSLKSLLPPATTAEP